MGDFCKKGSGITLTSLEDAKNYKSIGTYRDDSTELFLKSQGFTNLESVADDKQNVLKLLSGHINLWITGEIQGLAKAKEKGAHEKIEKVLEIKDTQLYIAFSRNTASSDIEVWQKALDAMKKDGTYETIVKKYM